MSLRNRIFLPVILSTMGVLVGCGGNGLSITRPTPPPTGGFSQSNLNGTYVFSASGTDASGFPYAIVGTFTANGSGGITGGVLDLNDAGFPGANPAISPIANASVTSGSYTLGVDGRGQIKLNNRTPFSPTIILDFVLQDSTHGLVNEFDGNASGSGSLDLQASGVTPTGSYAFIFSGAYGSSFLATVGNFTLNGATMSGLQDFNSPVTPYPNEALSGAFALGPSSTPATQVSSALSGSNPNFTITYDVVAIDATHLKFIEMDANGTLSGDAFAQSSTTFPAGALAFTMIGSTTSAVIGTGGFMVSDGNNNITTASTEDVNNTGSVSASVVPFSGAYAPQGTGRYTLSLAGFANGTQFVAYPSNGGVLLLQMDPGEMMAGAAYPQTAGATLDASQGYAMNQSGVNLGLSTGQSVEIDDIAEFATTSSGGTLTGIIDENFAPGSSPIYALALSGNYTTPDTNGRGQLGANAGNGNNTTLNGGFNLTYYAVDGTTFPFIETDNGQVTAGVFVKQNSSASSSAATRGHMYVLPPMVRSRIRAKQK